MWSNGILWANGEPWFDSLMVFKQPAYANGIVWSHAGEDNSVLWSDGILWAFSNEGAGDSVDGDGIMWSNGLLWSNSDLFDSWSPLFVDPESILPEQHEDDAPGVLVWGESFPGGDYRYGDVGAWYYPRQPE
jgi:hypothetical protein